MYRLLIVDDNTRDRNGVAKLKLWEELGFTEIYTARNGQEGYEKAVETMPTLVITDVSMPNIDGLGMAKKILDEMPKAKFIFVSCFDDNEYIRSAIDLNAFAYILKPINIEKLKETVIKILNISEKEKNQEQTINELSFKLKENMPIIREQVTRDWVYGKVLAPTERDLISLNLEIKNYCAVAQLQINTLDEKIETEGYMAINTITKILERTCNHTVRNSFFVRSKTELCMLMYFDNIDIKNSAVNECIDFYENLKNIITTEMNIDVSVYIGGVTNDYKEVAKLFERSDEFMRNGICSKGNSIIYIEETRHVNEKLNYDVIELKNEIFSLIENGTVMQISNFADKYLSEDMTVFAVKKFAFTVISTLQLVLFEMGENLNVIFGDEFIVWERMEKYHNTFEVKNLLVNVLQFAGEFVQNKKTDRYNKTVEDIKRIIEEQYATLKNVDEIVGQIYFSTVHANAIFKKYTGSTIFDYLTKYKIEHAKKMLASGSYKVYEVAEYLGYKSKNYFTVLFKEYTGLTPGQYRDKLNHEVKD